MTKKITLHINRELYQSLENHFKKDGQRINKFIVEAIRNQLSNLPAEPSPTKNDGLESYLEKGSSGSRTYGVKGQGW